MEEVLFRTIESDNKYKDICLKEKVDLSICINSNENKDCIIYEKMYENCMDFKNKKNDNKESKKQK